MQPTGETQIDPHEILLPTPEIQDITEDIKALRISTNYHTGSREAKNISPDANLLVTNHMYRISGGAAEEAGGTLHVITRGELPTPTSLVELIQKVGGTIPCYLDTETQTLVIACDSGYTSHNDKVHHGERADDHRITHKAVVLTRGLAKAAKGEPPIVEHIEEFDDEHIRSGNILVRDGIVLIDMSTHQIGEQNGQLLKDLGILPLEAYAHMVYKDKLGPIEAELETLGMDRLPVEVASHRLSTTFSYLLHSFSRSQDRYGIIFSPSLFVGALSKDNLMFPQYEAASLWQSEEFLQQSTILFKGGSIPISMIALEDRYHNILFVGSHGHPDAGRFFYAQASLKPKIADYLRPVAELDANLAIDTTKLSRDVLSNIARGSGMPIRVRVKKAEPYILERGSHTQLNITTGVDGEALVARYNLGADANAKRPEIYKVSIVWDGLENN